MQGATSHTLWAAGRRRRVTAYQQSATACVSDTLSDAAMVAPTPPTMTGALATYLAGEGAP